MTPPGLQDILNRRNPVQETSVSHGNNRLAVMERLHHLGISDEFGNRWRPLFDDQLRYGGAQAMSFDKGHRLALHPRNGCANDRRVFHDAV